MRATLFFPLTVLFLSSIFSRVSSQETVTWPPYYNNLTNLTCNNLDNVTNTCGMTGRIDNGFKWDDSSSTIKFIGAYAKLRDSENCMIFIRARNIIFQQSNITGCDIIIQGNLSVMMDDSILSVDGSQSLGLGYVNDPTIGNSYGGAGGFCGDGLAPDNTYGDFAMSYSDDEYAFGTGGSDGLSQGGGRIVIITKEFSAVGSQITANGYPEYCLGNETSSKGGTGGYIYITANSTFVPYKQNYILAQGGAGCGETSLGGSGGRIIISADVNACDKFTVSARGGQVSQSCGTGAAGTLYCENYLLEYPNALLIQQTWDVNFTIPTPTYVNLSDRDSLTLQVGPSATVAVQSSENGLEPIELQMLSLSNSSRLIYYTNEDSDSLNISATDTLTVDHSEIWCNCDIDLEAVNMVAISRQSFVAAGANYSTITINTPYLLVENSSIVFSEASPLEQLQQIINASDNGQYNTYLNSDGEIIDDFSEFSDLSDSLFEELMESLNSNGVLSSTSVIINTTTTNIFSGYVQSSFVYLNTNEFDIISGLLAATNLTCTGQSLPLRSGPVNPTLYNLDINQMATTYNYQSETDFIFNSLFQNYTLILIVQDEANINGVIQGSRIGLFGDQISISSNGSVTAAGLGCLSNNGPGFGVMGEDLGTSCASAGGSYGSLGGVGLSIGGVANASQCSTQLQSVPVIYGDPQSPLYEGSGGGSFNNTLGGAGGGVIIIGALSSLEVEGTVDASGSTPNVSGVTGVNGAGAGAGGSIQLFMTQFNGSGSIIANGGSVASNSLGGVGSGGRIAVNFLDWSQVLSSTDMPNIPAVLVGSGIREGSSMIDTVQIDGVPINSNGSLSGTPCPPGYFGLFCEPCNGNLFKADFSSKGCEPCIIPPGAVLSNQVAQESYMCDFTCEYEISYGGTRICYTSMILYNIHQGGGWGGIFALVCIIVITTYFMASMIIKKKQKKAGDREMSFSQSDLSFSDFKIKGRYFNNSHVQRINLLGDNTPESKWFIHTDTLNLREIEQIRDQIDHLIKSINRAMGWRKTWVYLLKFFVIAYPVAYFYLIQKFRCKLFKRIKALVKEINQELTEYCVIRSLPVYYITIKVDKHFSSGYLDLFQDDGDLSTRNNLLPVSLTITGNGKYCSPYRIDKSDPMLEHLVVSWAPKNCAIVEEELAYFRYEFRKFISKFNKKAKYIDYSAFFKTFKSHLAETINVVTEHREYFATNYNLFFNLFAFEIPRFTVNDTTETNSIQPFLQSPVRVTILEDTKGHEFLDLAGRLQRLKTEEDYDVKLYLIINSGRDLQSVSQKSNDKRTEFVFLQESQEVHNQPKTTNLEELKESFFKKLDDISFNIEYSIPRQIKLQNPSLTKKQKMSSAKRRVFATSRRYFKALHEVFHALVGFKYSTKRIAQIYVIMGILIVINLCFLWFRVVSIFILGLDKNLWMIWFPFPLVTVFSPLVGLLGLVSRSSKVTLFFGLLNACCLINHVLSFVIVASVSENSLAMYLFELCSCLLFIATLFACKYLLPLQN